MLIETDRFTIEFTRAHIYLRTPWFETYLGRLGAKGAWHIAWDGPKTLRKKRLARQRMLEADVTRLAA